jgi:PAT family beta-lactamase induction signal transducer AmpG
MGLSNATFGLVGGFIVLPLPQMLAGEGVPEWKIAAVSAACFSPGFWVFLLGPVLDVRFTRRWYASVFAALAGLGLTVAVLSRAHLVVLEIALMLAYAAAVMSSNALGGWLAGIVAADEQASLSAWTQVAVFLGNGAMAALAGDGMRRLPLAVIGPALGVLAAAPALIFAWMPVGTESALEAGQTPLRERFRMLFAELKSLLRRREVLLTLALFVLPTGSFALTNQLGGVAGEFHASEAFVSRMGGVVLSVAGALACLLVPVLARWARALPLYLGIGTVGSLFTLALLVLPRTPATFAVAFLGENVVQAMSFTAAVAICFRTIGRDNPLAATQFSMLTSATVLPILYMGVADGRSFGGGGLPAMYAVDGGISLAACALMAAVMWRHRLED